VRDVLAQALSEEIWAKVEDPGSSEIIFGMYGGVRRTVPVNGLRIGLSPTADPVLTPHAVTLVVKRAQGQVAIVPDVSFGQPDDLIDAAWSRGLPAEVATGAVEAVLEALGRLVEPEVPIAALHAGEQVGWEVYRFLEVRAQVIDPARQMTLRQARRMEPDSGPGDLIGVNMTGLDWLTPMLWWMGGCG
jgi:hypothetical protein